jgi:hypothetical protein
MTASVQFDLGAGVAVRVFAHELPSGRGVVPCLSYVTDGLRRYHQQELAVTLVRPPGAEIQQPPPEAMQLLASISALAQQGRLVENGGMTEVGATGLFGRPAVRGLAYQTAAPMQGVVLPDGCLGAIALVAHEIETVKRFGGLRVLARIGRAHGFFPTAPWCDPDRGPLMAPEAGTLLESVASVHLRASVVLADGRVTLRIPTTVPLPELPPPELALAFLTVLDPTADGCLVWVPGQQTPEAITLPGRAATRLSGCFVAFVPQQPADGANLFEDGFAAMLTDRTWAALRHALATRTPIALPPTAPNTHGIAIEWVDETRPRATVPPCGEMRMTIRESQPDIDARIGMNQLVAYATAFEQTVQAYFALARGTGRDLHIEVVLSPGRPPTLFGQLDPALHARLSTLPAPAVRLGEIAFRGSFALFGGSS